MRVEIKGTLSSKSRQFKHKLAKFSSTFDNRDGSTLTRINLSRDVDFAKSLDEVAKGLERAMGQKNIQKTAMELPNPTPASLATDETLVDDGQETQAESESVEEPDRWPNASHQVRDELIDILRNQLVREMNRSANGPQEEAPIHAAAILESPVHQQSPVTSRIEPQHRVSPGYRGLDDRTPNHEHVHIMLLPARMLLALFQMLKAYVLGSALALSLAFVERQGRMVVDRSPEVKPAQGVKSPSRRQRPAIEAPPISILPPQPGMVGIDSRGFLRPSSLSPRRGNSW